MKLDRAVLREFAEHCAAARCSQDAARVTACYSTNDSLRVNDAAPAVGRSAVTAAAQEFMTMFPDMIVAMDNLVIQGDSAVFQWTLTGANTGPGGTGKRVRTYGFEEWEFGEDGLVSRSQGHFDSAEYQRQLKRGVGDCFQ